jgi:uncharacterized protein YjbJ (UPF0337 family)
LTPRRGGQGWDTPDKEQHMSLGDKISGRVKQAVGDLTGDKATEREGKKEERKGEAKDQLAGAQDRVENKAAEVQDLERKT